MPPSVKPPNFSAKSPAPMRQRDRRRDEVARAREVDAVLHPDPRARRGDQAEHDDATGRPAPAPGIVMISAPNFGEKPSTIATQRGDDEQQRRVDLRHRHDADVLRVRRHAGAAAGAATHRREAVADERAAEVRIEVAAGHRRDGLDVAEVLGDEDDRHRRDQRDRVARPTPAPRSRGMPIQAALRRRRRSRSACRAQAVGADGIEQVAGETAEQHRQAAREPGARTATRPTATMVATADPVSSALAEMPFTAIGARLRPITATTLPVTTGGIRRSIQR